MTKEELKKLKRKLLALGMLGIMVGTSGCKNADENGVPIRRAIPKKYNSFNEYVEYVVRDGKANIVCKTDNICLLYNKETFEVKEYIFDYAFKLFNETYGGDAYEIETGELIFHNNGFGDTYNKEYLLYLIDNNYSVPLSELSNYIEGIEPKEYYTLEEIRELEPQILESLKIIIDSKTKKL